MAKFQGFIGNGRGKAGNLVFSKGIDGTTIARAYQPQVKNPRTTAQLLQRAKMNTAGRFSALVPAELIRSLGYGSNLRNRSEFTKSLLMAATATMVDEKVTAQIAPADVKFSKGTEQLLTTAATPVVINNKVTVTLTTSGVPAEMLNKYGERIIVGILDDETNGLYDTIVYLDHIVTGNSSTEDVVFTLNNPLMPGQTVVVWREAFVLNLAGSSIHTEGVHMDDSQITAIMATSSTSLVYRRGETHLVDIVPFVQGQ